MAVSNTISVYVACQKWQRKCGEIKDKNTFVGSLIMYTCISLIA